MSSKGKEREIDPPKKRSIYHYLPDNAKDSWLGVLGMLNKRKENLSDIRLGESLPPMNQNGESTTFSEFIDKSLPELFRANAPHHECIYCNLLLKYIEEGLRKLSMERLNGMIILQDCFHN